MTAWLALTVAIIIGVSVVRGAPYVPILRRDRTALLGLAQIKPGQTIIDLGSGDGRLLRAAAARGATAIGYEINPVLVLVSRLVCWRYRSLVTVRLADMWLVKLPPADVIYVFLLDRYMERLDRKLTAEITKPTRLVSYVFKIPGRKPVAHNGISSVYQYGTTNSEN